MKKALSLVLFAAMLISVFAFNTNAAWNGTSISSLLKGEGTIESPYVVETAEATIAGFDPSKGVPKPPAPETTEPAQSEPTGDSAVIFIAIALISLIGVTVIAKRREN